MTERALLRLHIEAVWGISVPSLDSGTVELSAANALPPWLLYQATLADGQVIIWRPGIFSEERAALLKRAHSAGPAFDSAHGMRREVVLQQTVTPHSLATPRRHAARLLTAEDAALLEAFESGSAEYFLSPHRAPCFGVLVAGQLASVAHSSRWTSAACELGINTKGEYRRQGYARAATLAWTHAVQRTGLTPIYSAFAHNTASLRLAAATGYVQVSESVYGPFTDANE